MAIDVFVSYHTATSLDAAREVVQKLESQGLRCWYQDRDSHGAFGGVIKRAIGESKAFVVILDSGAMRSPHVLTEVSMACDRRNMAILPFLVTKEALSDDMDYYLHRIHWIDGYSRSRSAALEDLCRRTLKALGRPAPIPGPVIHAKTETIRYNDGCVYTGQVVNGKRHGKGRITWPSGDIYEGDWKDDKRTGKGKKIWANGDIYEGDWKDGVCTGKGKYTWGKDSKWAGDIYEGDWKDGNRTGKGKYTWPNGDVYEGDFVDDKRTGKGKYTWGKDSKWAGDVYEGDFVDGKRTGIGTYTYANGRIKSGRWKEGKFLG